MACKYFVRYPLDIWRERRITLGAETKHNAPMTIEQQDSLTRELDGAMQSGDDQRIRCAQSNILLALMDCQRKTSERVKRLSWKFMLAMVAVGSSVGFGAGKADVIKALIGGN